MWIGTLSGLNRFDGTGVKLYRNDPDNPNSLSHNVARALAVDQSGFLWIGTWGGGLNQFVRETDTFIRYQHDPDDPRSLSHNIVRAVYEDHSGTIWVGTMEGLNKLDRDVGQFTRYQHDPDDSNSLSDNVIWSIFEDSAGVLWVGTENGLNRFDPDSETFVHYRKNPDEPVSLSHNSVRSVFEDRLGNLWVGTGGGLDKLNPDRTQITSYQHDENDPQSLSHNIIHWVHEDRSGRLWIGTWGGGLNLFDRDTETFTSYRHNSADPYSLNSDSIWQIYEGQQDMLWIATEGGISYFDGRAKPFHHYRAIPGAPNSLSDSHVNSLHAGQDGVVWVATNSGGLNKFERQTEAFTQYLNSASDLIDISNDNLTAAYEDQMGLIWIGTRGTGLIKYDPDTEQITNYRYDDTNPHSLSYDSVVNIYEDRNGTLWIGTYGGGLNAFDRDTEQFTRYQHNPSDPHSLSANVVISVYEDRAGVLWVGTISDGLNKLDRETGEFIHYRHDASDPHSLSGDAIASIYEQETGDFWIGTASGLNKFDRQKDQVVGYYFTKHGLPDETISGILEDEHGVLWLGTQNGLSRFDPNTESFRNYTISDGLQGKSFALYSSPSKSPSGEMFFAGSGGFNAFYPDHIVDNLNPPPVLITSFQLANKPVPIGGDSVLQKSILETDELVLSYQDNIFSLEFVALDYRDPEKNRYKYKMEGFEEEWNKVDSARRFATYTNLDPGDYVFRVIASNNDGIWNEEGASIRITITPPWWETAWFRIGLGVLVIGLLAGGFRWRVSSLQARSRELETQVSERTQELQVAKEDAEEAKEIAEEANQAKSTFLANMSHELRTPLNAILGFTRLMARDESLSAQQQDRLKIINRSGEHLLDMVGDILTLSRIEAGRVRLSEETFALLQTLEDIGRIFQSRAHGKGLRFLPELADELPSYLRGDVGKLRQVLINLLDNAVKYTQEGGVYLRARAETMDGDPDRVMLQMEVEDSGPGIPSDRLDEIFETFVRFEPTQQTEAGAGLGLSISKSLVDMMGGELAVESQVGQGTRFEVKVPMVLADGEAAGPAEPSLPEVIGWSWMTTGKTSCC
jgi:signal transduction histidine kinase/streptogramin lyase